MAEEPFDVLVRDVRVVSVATGEVAPASIGVRAGRIATLRASADAGARAVVEGEGRFAVPGFIDAHMHIESSFLTPRAFAPAALARGTTTIAADPHEIANVMGERGVRAMLAESRGLDLSIFYLVPSCVPSVPGLETSGGTIGVDETRRLLRHPRVLGLGEVMDYRGVIGGDARITGILEAARSFGRHVRIEGHAPNLKGTDLEAFMLAGVATDHTDNATSVWLEKMRLGMFAELQAKALKPELVEAMQALPLLPPFALVTDDVATDTLVHEGHLDRVARIALGLGLDPLVVLRALTLWPAMHLGLTDRGQLGPGRRADVVVTADLRRLAPDHVIARGRPVAAAGAPLRPGRRGPGRTWAPFRNSLHLDGLSRLTPEDLTWRLGPGAPRRRLAAMGWRATDNRTEALDVVLDVADDGTVQWQGRAALACVMERYTGRMGRAFAPLLGLELDDGAVATTYAHDSHNLTIVGASAEAMARAATAVVEAGGGIAVAKGRHVLALMPLPIAGILSERDAAAVAAEAKAVREAMAEIGYRHFNPFMSVSTLPLLVSLERKLSDRGLVDVDRRQRTPDPDGGAEAPATP